MARKPVIEIVCGRCGRKEYQPLDEDSQRNPGAEVALVVTFMGESHQFDDLCSKCRETCKNYVDSLTKDVKGSKVNRKRRGPSKKNPSTEASLPSTNAAESRAARARPTS